MLKTLLAEVKEYKKASFLTPAFMLLEVAMEMIIPSSWRPSSTTAFPPEICVTLS